MEQPPPPPPNKNVPPTEPPSSERLKSIKGNKDFTIGGKEKAFSCKHKQIAKQLMVVEKICSYHSHQKEQTVLFLSFASANHAKMTVIPSLNLPLHLLEPNHHQLREEEEGEGGERLNS